MKHSLILSLAAAALLFISCGGSDDSSGGNDSPSPETLTAQLPTKANKMNVYAHFMIWFETNKTSLNTGKWGWHWTMNASLNPGSGEIASYYHPLTGAYASGDADVLDYQCLLMKYSGIDGVIVDWYGSDADNNTARHTSNTVALFNAIKKAGLKLSICYEDNTYASAADPVASARTDMTYLARNFFSSDNYAKVDGKPLLLDFGPQAITTPKDWYRVFQSLTTKPEFIVLNGASSKANDATYTNSEGEFLWVNPNPAAWYTTAKKSFSLTIGGAMPGFKDYYKLGNAGDGYTTYDDEGGALFTRQLEAARTAGLDWLQISTWNDYGEGTVIEPTKEFGYRYLTALQTFTGVSYKQSQLEIIYKWYTLKVKYAADSAKTKILNQCYDYLNALQPDKAESIMSSL
jgi:hypothetical protein